MKQNLIAFAAVTIVTLFGASVIAQQSTATPDQKRLSEVKAGQSVF